MSLRGWLALLSAIALAIALCTGNVLCWLIASAGLGVLWLERRGAIETPFRNSGEIDG
jgi:hypothetical protein